MSTPELPSTFYYTDKIDFSKHVDPNRLKDQSIIVTGGANGIGAGSVTAFAEAGAHVTILDLNEEKGNALVEGLTGKGLHVQFVKTDVTSWTSQTDGFKSAIQFSPRKTVDLVLASAGVAGTSIKSWLENVSASTDSDPQPPRTAALDINLIGSHLTTHLALYYFKKTARPEETTTKHLIYVSSLAGFVGIANVGDYVGSKYGVRGLWRSIRYCPDMLGEGMPKFRTNLIAPTYIKTDMTKDIEGRLHEAGFSLGEVDDVVAGVMRAACDDDIQGRAIACSARDKVPGDRNFDLCDDWEGLDAGKELLGHVRDGTIWGLELIGSQGKLRE